MTGAWSAQEFGYGCVIERVTCTIFVDVYADSWDR